MFLRNYVKKLYFTAILTVFGIIGFALGFTLLAPKIAELIPRITSGIGKEATYPNLLLFVIFG